MNIEELDFYKKKLEQREAKGNLRQLRILNANIDFSSNDYLGLAKSGKFYDAVLEKLNHLSPKQWGATGSRLLNGNNPVAEELEKTIAQFHKGESALLFNSGFSANCGFFASVPQADQTIFYDEQIHASVREGIRLSKAKDISFQHNDLSDLEEKINSSNGQIFVTVESVYSMDGDSPDFFALTNLCEKRNIWLVVDEAHSVGIYGVKGEGLIVELGLEQKCFARLYTYGKAFGSHGAAWVVPKLIKEFLINYSREFIFSTALPIPILVSLQTAYEWMPGLHNERRKLFDLVNYFRSKNFTMQNTKTIPVQSPVQAIFVNGNNRLKKLSEYLQENDFDVRPIYSPTVDEGTERLRIILHAYNTTEEIDLLHQSISAFQSEIFAKTSL